MEEIKRRNTSKEDEEIGTFTNKGRSKKEVRNEKIASVSQAAKANWWKHRPEDDVY